jgi:RNA polymerase sigma-70 factor (subfamily 1)
LRDREGPPNVPFIVSPPGSRLQDTLSLVRNAQDGDRKAFEALFERYYPRVRAIVRARMGAALRRRMETGDLLQWSMVEAIRSFEHYQVRGDAGFVHWLAGIVQNRIGAANRDAGRQKRDRGREVALEHVMHCLATDSLRFEPAISEPLPVDRLVDEEQEELLSECLQELKESHREVILMRCYAGASWEETARLLGYPTADAARALYYRATRGLKQAFDRRAGT